MIAKVTEKIDNAQLTGGDTISVDPESTFEVCGLPDFFDGTVAVYFNGGHLILPLSKVNLDITPLEHQILARLEW